jgi:hypothetical protein
MSQDPEDAHLRIFLPESEDDVLDDSAEWDTDDPDRIKGPDLDTVFAKLTDGTATFLDLVGFSDLSKEQVADVRTRWPGVPLATRELTARHLVELSEQRWDVHLARLFRVLLDDESAVVRQFAVSGIEGEDDEGIVPMLLTILRDDPSDDVRTAAALALSPIAELAELDELDDPSLADDIREGLYAVLENTAEPMSLRRRVLESVSTFTQDERLPRFIEELFAADQLGSRTSAIFAMGRTYDRRWFDVIIGEFTDDDAEVRFEAARAIGRYGDTEALPELGKLARDDDAEVRQAAIAAIGDIGGKPAIRLLEQLKQRARTDAERDALDAAVEEAEILDEEVLSEFDDVDASFDESDETEPDDDRRR